MPNDSHDTIISLYALATRLEDEGQLNLAKLARASAESYLRRTAYRRQLPADKQTFISEIERLTPQLEQLDIDPTIRAEFARGADDLKHGKLTLYASTPNPYLCRICGYLTADVPTADCPVCHSDASSFMQIMPHYWFDALEPYAALATMQGTPRRVASLIQDLTEEQMQQSPPDASWNLRTVITHFRDANQVLAYRMNLILVQDNPPLESLALFETADQKAAAPETTRAIFDSYLHTRAEIVEKLKHIPLAAWWRTGQHSEFGKITLKHQVSYFVAHEVTHLPQINTLRTLAA